MNAIHIFKAGKHTSAGGATFDFSEDMLKESAAAYNPDNHRAPIVIGHPKDNAPAYGWIDSISYNEKGLYAHPSQVNNDFAELVKAGAYQKVSASFYSPDSPVNPAPGKLSLRHVGFLGAQAPAIKGLEQYNFNDSDDGVIEFSCVTDENGENGLLSRIADYFGLTPKGDNSAHQNSDFNETSQGDDTMNEAELKAAQADLDAKLKQHKEDVANFNEQKTSFESAQQAARKAAIASRVDALVTSGRVLPARAQAVKDFAENLAVDTVIEFGEIGKTEKQSAEDFFFSLIGEGEAGVDFAEHSAGGEDGESSDFSEHELADKAQDLVSKEAAAGRDISFTEAVNRLQA